MKKIIRVVCLLFAVLFLFAACDSGEHVHEYGQWKVITPAACLSGEERRVCSCGAEEYFYIPSTGMHDFTEKVVEDAYICTPATCQTPALYYYKCTACAAMSTETYEVARPWAHTYKNGVCTLCNREQGYERDKDTIYFGTYPQTAVTDNSLKAKLKDEAGTLPTKGKPQLWTSYGYYYSGKVQDYMWYIDVPVGSDKYRGVYFESYRPEVVTNSSSTGNSYQDDNVYYTKKIYWFKYEPISWTILKEDDGKALLLCNMVIDNQPFYTSTSNRTQNQTTIYANNYEYSAVRKWLNDTFYQTAFGEYQQQIILKTTVNNSAATTGTDSNQYACNSTTDKVFLLSYADVTNNDYGFKTSSGDGDTFRKKKATDYAQAQGMHTEQSGNNKGMAYWWMRSPSSSSSSREMYGRPDGKISADGDIRCCSGMVPAIWIQLG